MGIKIQDDHSSRDSIRLVDKENVANQLKHISQSGKAFLNASTLVRDS